MSTETVGGAAGGLDVMDRELEKLLNQEQLEDGDHERFSHYVPKDKIVESAVTGKPVRALCGKKWTPSVSYTHLRAHETEADLVCRLLLVKKKRK